jgi:hypothetical protein
MRRTSIPASIPTSIPALIAACVTLFVATSAGAAPLGSACADASACDSGLCVDGVCCDQACRGQCQACDVASSLGTCIPVTGAPHGSSRAACTSDPTNACANATCDGVDVTQCAGFPSAGQPCAAASCVSLDVAAPTSFCDGHGACEKAAIVVCDPFVCDPGSVQCASTCVSSSDCATSFWCGGSTCLPLDQAICTSDLSASQSSSGNEIQCSPFLCDVANGQCATSCIAGATNPCASGFECDSTGTCAQPPAAAVHDKGSFGCDVGARGREGSSGFAIVLAAGAIVGRRRRKRAIAIATCAVEATNTR